MKHLGDITKIKNASFVDCITFGSPCQNLSIAGKREGLAGEQSGLFIEAVRIIKEMREQSGGLYPTFAVWENVPGAFSSNSGEDFRIVLEELARIEQSNISIPRPENGKWAKAGFIAGNEWSIAWRTFDAKFWGVPQRRRRIAVVVDFGGQRAGEILFERTGVSGNPEPSIPTWKGIARNPAHGTAGHDRVVEGAGFNGYKSVSGSIQFEKETAATLESNMPGNVLCLQGNMIDRDVKQNGSGISESETMFTINATDRHGVLCAAFTAGQGAKANGIGYAEEQAPTLLTGGGLSAMPTVVMNAPYQDTTGPLMANSHPGSYCGQDAYTDMFVTCKEVFENHSQDARYAHLENTCSTMVARWGTGGNNMPLVAEKYIVKTGLHGDISETLDSNYYKGPGTCSGVEREMDIVYTSHLRWLVRRLTPTECERLQGFPDGWTDIGEWYDSTTGQGYWLDSKGKRHKTADSPRYKALGNSIALPQWWWITCKMAPHLRKHATLGSLFDGIGGFPLVWETYHGKGTTIWASEIEEFPIAVTKENFK